MSVMLFWAPPSEGKSYVGTAKAIEWLLDGERVFTNYPVIYNIPLPIHKKVINILYKIVRKKPKYTPKQLSTLKWDESFINAHLNNCKIILDEAYKYYNSHKRTVEDDVHEFFATVGHNDVDVILIAQHYNRINLTLREIANYYVYIEKVNNPLTLKSSNPRKGQLMPLFFKVEYYISEEDFRLRRIKDTVYEKKRVWFSKKIAHSYNTQQFRIPEKEFTPIKWNKHIKDLTEAKEKEKELMSEQEAIDEFAKSELI